MIFACSTDGKVFTMQADRSGLKTLGISSLDETTHNTPAISEGRYIFPHLFKAHSYSYKIFRPIASTLTPDKRNMSVQS